MNNDFFDKIEGKDTTKNKSISERKNMYQVVAIIFLIISGLAGIILGVKETCSSSTYGSCEENFDFSYTLMIWVSGFIAFLFMYGFGEIIKYLQKISKSLEKK